ncbi:MAG: CidA/LrgA family protein [Micrococcales bacterium]|nr:CidA/LrgA family protein [Micrococcales bacterium]
MLSGLIALLACQLAGEFLVRALSLRVPGPVVGMLLLLAFLTIRDWRRHAAPPPEESSRVERAADAFLTHLPVLFIPAAVGVMQYFDVIAEHWGPVLGGNVIAWLATLVITAGAAQLMLTLLPDSLTGDPEEAEARAMVREADRIEGLEADDAEGPGRRGPESEGERR